MRRIAIMLLIILIGFAATGVAGRVQNDTRWMGEGIKLGFFFSPLNEREICVGDASYFRMGWSDPVYPGYQNDMRDYYGKNAIVGSKSIYVLLWVDGERVSLNRNIFWAKYSEFGPDASIPFYLPGDTDCKIAEWYFQFPSNYFSPGTHEISWELAARNPNHVFWLFGPGVPIVGTTILTVNPE